MRVLFIILALLSLLFYTNDLKAQTVNLNGLELWLKNDFGVISSGGFVTEWKDASGNNNHCIQANASFQPTVNSSIPSINSNNVSLVFDGVDDYLLFTASLTNIRTLFFVIKHNGVNVPYAPILGHNASYDFLGDDAANNIFNALYTEAKILNGNIRINKLAVGSVSNAVRPSNYSIISLTTTGNVSASQITRDRSNANRVWGGEYSEVMIYNRLFTAIQIDSIENYLVNKYSPTLELGSDISVQQLNGCIPTNSITVQANPDFQTYLWSNGNTTNQINVNQYGQYSVICTDVFGINHYDTINVIPTIKNFNYPTNNIICGNNTIVWNTQLNNIENIFQWQNSNTDSLFIINSPGQYFVAITDTFGCIYNSDTVTITQDNFASSISLGPDISLCAGNSINLISGASPSLTYTWSTGSINDSLLVTNTGQYSVIATNTNNCVAKDTINVTVSGQAPTANFTTNIGCINSIISFTNASIPPSGNTIDSTFWDFGEPLSTNNTSTLTSPVHTYTNTGTYLVTLKAITNAGCEQSITKTITVYPIPNAAFAVGLSCQNDTTAFLNQSTSTAGYSITAFNWDFGDLTSGSANNSTITSPKHVFGNQTNYSVKLIATNNVGCKDSITNTVNVRAQVSASFTNTPACANTPIIFQDNSIVPPPSASNARLWNFGSSTSTGLSVSKTYTSSGVYSVSLTVTGNNGCVSKISKTLTVFLPPIASFTIPNLCFKDTLTISNLSVPQSGIMSSYNWKLNNTTFSSVQNPTLTTASAGSYSVELTATNSFGCKDIITKMLTVLPLPIVDFTTIPISNYFINSPITFTPSITNANSYLWNISSSATSTVQSPSTSFNNEGTYTISLNLTDQFGCKNSNTKTISINRRYLDMAILNVKTIKDNDGFMIIEADVANYGSVPITSFDMHYQISDGGNVKETWTGTLNPNAFYVYTFNSKSSTQTENSNNITCIEIEKVNGIIDENITNNNLCNVLNLDEVSVSNPIPNPTDGDITLPIILNKDIDVTISIYNSIGQIQYEETTQKGTNGLNFITLPSSLYSRGCYIIKIVIDDKVFIKKFIVVRND